MEAVGILGIIKLTTQIMVKNYKHFMSIAVLWVIPCALFHLHLLDLSSAALDALVGSWLYLYHYFRLFLSGEQFPSISGALPPNSTALPPYNANAPFPKLQLASLPPIIARIFVSAIIPLVFQPVLTFSVCRACVNKSLSLKGSFLSVPRSVRNLAITAMCIGLVAFGFVAMSLGMMGIILLATVLARGNEPATVTAILGCTFTVMAIVGVYLAISFSLAPTVAILEETRGWRAMRRNLDLVNGRKWAALGLVVLCYGLQEAMEYAAGAFWGWRSSADVVITSLQLLVALFGMAAHVVLYMSCKRRREEPFNTLVAASARFGPELSSPQSMDVETAAFLSALPK